MNIRLPHKHNFRVRAETVSIYGAEYVCLKCLKTDFTAWTTQYQVALAEIYLTVKSPLWPYASVRED